VNIRDAIVRWITPDERGIYLGPPVRPSSRANRECLAQHLARALGDIDVESLDAQHVWALQQDCLARGLAVATTNAVSHGVLRAMLRDLQISADVRVRIGAAKQVRKTRTERVLHFDADQRDAAIAALEGSWGQPIGAFGFFTGCRIGEIAGLQWGDIHEERRIVRIDRQRVGSAVYDCKTAASHRVLRYGERLAAVLAALERGAPGDFVFRGRHGRPFDVHTFRAQVWYPRLAAAGLPKLAVHGMRHSWATIALTAGMPLAQVAAHLGDSERIVRDTYAHVTATFDPDVALGGGAGTRPTRTTIRGDRDGRPLLRVVR
jgi:integrase